MDIYTSKLISGIGFVFKRVTSPVAYCALSIKAGTRDEEPLKNGIAHLTEHMLFKGTNKRGAISINNYLERLGGELNAYTTKEETVIHATVLKEDLSKAVELLSDLAFNSQYPLKELAKERDIVLEEISSYKDTPSEQIFDDFEEIIFGGHALSMPILGKPKTIKSITANDIKTFTESYYTTSNMSFSIVADISPQRGLALVDRYFGNREFKEWALNSSKESKKKITFSPVEERVRKISRKTYQAHCVVGTTAYSLYDPKRLHLALLTNILGGPALNSRLNQTLRERRGLAYTVDATYTPYTDTGLFTIYFGCDKANIQKCSDLITKELNNLIEREISPVTLKAAKKQLLGQLAISTDNAEAQCLSMGKSLLFYGKVEPIEQVRDKISAIDSVNLREVAAEVFKESGMFTLIYS